MISYRKEYGLCYVILNRDRNRDHPEWDSKKGRWDSTETRRSLHKLVCDIRGIDEDKGIRTDLGRKELELFREDKPIESYPADYALQIDRHLEDMALFVAINFPLRESDTIVASKYNPPIHNLAWSFYSLSQKDLDYFKQKLGEIK